MEGSSSTARASAATLVKNTGVAEADVVPGGWSRRGAAASGGGLVLTVADEQEHGLGGEIVPDLNVQPMAEDPLLGETSSVRKRKFEEFDDSEDSGHSYISSEVESGDAVSYNSDASSDNEVSKYNVLSYEKKVEEKIWAEGISAYMKPDGRYYCKFHPSKQVPRDGMREGLVSHVKEVHPKDLRDKANHAAPRKLQLAATATATARASRLLSILLASSVSKALIPATAAIRKAPSPETAVPRNLLHARPNTVT
nr:uncharacterized protein LOC127303795 [Lolium perenne]